MDGVVELSLLILEQPYIDSITTNLVWITHYQCLLEETYICSITTIDGVVELSLLIIE